MIRYLVLALLALFAFPAQAQSIIIGGVCPPATAPAGTAWAYQSPDGVHLNCTQLTIPTGGTSLTAGSGISIANGVIATNFPVTTTAVARPITQADGAHTISYTGTTTGIFALPAAGTVLNGWVVCFYGRSQAGSVTISAASGVPVYGGPLTITWKQFQCAQQDDAGGWLLSGVSPVVPNPAPFQ